MRGTFIKVDRALLDWEWFGDSKTLHVFMYLLLSVNYRPGKWKGHPIDPGSTVTSRAKIALATGLSEKQVRTSLDRLEEVGTVARSLAGRGQLISLVKWADYQLSASEEGREVGQMWAGIGPELGRERAAIKEGKKERKKEGKKEMQMSARKPRRASIEDRIAEFKAQCAEVVNADPERLPAILRKEFTAYWTETNKAGTMRFERQEFFDHGRRMDTWRERAKGDHSGGSMSTPVKMTESDALAVVRQIKQDRGVDHLEPQDMPREVRIALGWK